MKRKFIETLYGYVEIVFAIEHATRIVSTGPSRIRRSFARDHDRIRIVKSRGDRR